MGLLTAEPPWVGLTASDLLEVRHAHNLPSLIATHASELAGCAVAIYVVDLDGSSLLRLAGGGVPLPDRFGAPLAVGTELPLDAVAAVRELIARAAPDVDMVPLVVRDRALGVMLAAGPTGGALDSFAIEAAFAMEMATGYTDVVHAARRRKPVKPGAEVQQNLLPPRIATVSSYQLAGGVLPGYEIGGDFFDYADNSDGLWIAIGDAVGKGNAAAALSSIALGALRAARRSGATIHEAAEIVHETVAGFGIARFLTAVLAICDPDGVVRWLSAGHPRPLHLDRHGVASELMGGQTHPLGLFAFDRRLTLGQVTLFPGEQFVLYSDGLTERKATSGERLGFGALERCLLTRRPTTPAGTVRALHSLVIEAATEPLDDDVTVLAMMRLAGPSGRDSLSTDHSPAAVA